MINVILTAVVCHSPLPYAATTAEIEQADCQFSTRAITSNHRQCDAIRTAYMTDIGPVNFYGYFLCAWDQQSKDPSANYIPITRQKFNSQKGF